MDFLLDVERRRVDDEIAPVLLILAAPDELRIEVGVARILYRLGLFFLFLKHGLVLSGRDVLALGLVVLKSLDGFGDLGADFLAMIISGAGALRVRRRQAASPWAGGP